jgi:hypothetical protein
MKILLDTNVVLSAAWRDRLPEKVVQHVATHGDCEWIVTAEIQGVRGGLAAAEIRPYYSAASTMG